jgi:hypothetical protein
MAQPFRITDGDDPGRDRGGWDENGNVDLPGVLTVDTIRGSGSSTPALTTVIIQAALSLLAARTTTDVLAIRVDGEVAPRLIVNGDGTMEWGGGAVAPDISLNRYAAGGLEISGALRFTNGQILFGAAGDVNLYWGGAGQLKTDDFLIAAGGAQSNAEFTAYTGAAKALIAGTAGGGLAVAEGTNARMGRATLVAGTVVVANTSVTATTEIFLTCQTPGGTPGFLRVSARTAATSFTILSSSGSDTSVVGYLLVEPA